MRWREKSRSPKLWVVPFFFFFFLFFVVVLFLFWGDRKRERKKWTCIWHFQCTKKFLFWLFCTNLGGRCWFPYFAKKETGTHIEKLQLLKVTQLIPSGAWVCPKWTSLASKPACCLLSSSTPPFLFSLPCSSFPVLPTWAIGCLHTRARECQGHYQPSL